MEAIRARVKNGRIEPIGPLMVPDGTEVEVYVVTHPGADHTSAFRSSFGGWAGTIDVETFLKNVRVSRQVARQSVRL